jgi:hypothetical protein
MRRPADELARLRAGFRFDQPEHCGAVGRGDRHQAFAGLKAGVQRQVESKLIQVKPQAALLISNENVDVAYAEIQILSIQPSSGLIRRKG